MASRPTNSIRWGRTAAFIAAALLIFAPGASFANKIAVDTDKDGILDRVDYCPNSPEDRDGFEDENGCPEEDNDRDGVLDVDDKCPNAPEDQDGFEDADGCPELDNDGDGIPDVSDQCPNEPEVIDGHDDEDGCPGEAPVAPIKVTPRIEIKAQIFFDPGLVAPNADAAPILKGVVTLLIDNPEIVISIAGHSCTADNHKDNKLFSGARAQEVRARLIAEGIAPDRLSTIGLGCLEAHSPEARPSNERVNFYVKPGK